MSTAQKLALIKTAYPGDRWQERVKTMSDAQIHATYMRLLNKGQFKSYSSK